MKMATEGLVETLENSKRSTQPILERRSHTNAECIGEVQNGNVFTGM
jgi:hypothetical protein